MVGSIAIEDYRRLSAEIGMARPRDIASSKCVRRFPGFVTEQSKTRLLSQRRVFDGRAGETDFEDERRSEGCVKSAAVAAYEPA